MIAKAKTANDSIYAQTVNAAGAEASEAVDCLGSWSHAREIPAVMRTGDDGYGPVE